MKNRKIYVLSDSDIKGAIKLPVIEQNFFNINIDFKKYDYLVFTSKNGVIAVDRISSEWKKIDSIAIGKATAKKIEELGGKVAYVAKKFYGDELAKEISQNFDKSKKFLYLRAKKVLSNLSEILRKREFLLEEIIVYETVCKKIENKRVEKGSFIIFSSPSTIECFLKNFQWDKSYKAIAIGKKTASYIPKDIEFIISPVQTLQGTINFIKESLDINN
ncbi:uroporphyrinogen-III synthase [Nitrosophilus kaiyonis]|uniref:uroporphyrinogen-III synthase n=1 Tax=Nitrosophilus kaiyonis TaxID=2930200 RepID=UPI0024902244|nr:uroporphyrinogen-III synthase [Nitrosophilus kaiyonis]